MGRREKEDGRDDNGRKEYEEEYDGVMIVKWSYILTDL